jgi:RNA 2',3'-cyclic 3'-phosphodiesterase
MSRIRTFIAVDIGDAIRERIVSLQETLGRNSSGVKWVEKENLHVTLHFLGEVGELDIVKICRVAKEQLEDMVPFTMNISGLGCFPTPRRPKILWVGVEEGSEQLTQIHSVLEQPLFDLGCYRREERAFHPHITLGRLNQEDRQETWSQAITKYQDWQGGEVKVKEVLIVGSELRREGPLYTIMGRAKLNGSPKAKKDEDE